MLIQISSIKTTTEAYVKTQDTFSSKTRARTINVWLVLANTKKINLSIYEYLRKMKFPGDEMTTFDQPEEEYDKFME